MAQRKFSDLTVAAQINKSDVFALEQTDGTKQALFEKICAAILPADVTTKQLHDEIISALLAYTMNEKILKVVSDHGVLAADYAIQKREQMASYGYFGAEWNIDDLMTLVKAGAWDKFAIGDYLRPRERIHICIVATRN